jgi:DNA-binding NarL/FixJ family response regulator
METTKQITVFIAEDHLISRMGLRMLIEQNSRFTVIGEAEDGQSAIDNILQLKPDVVMMDLGLPKVDGVAATAAVKRELPDAKILIFTTAEDDESISSALKAGADGYCLKTISGENLSTAIQSVLSGAAWLDPGIAKKVLRAQSQSSGGPRADLTASKMELLSLVEKGKSVEEIASALSVNDALVKGLLQELLTQLKGDTVGGAKDPAKDEHKNQASAQIRPGDIIGGHYKIEERIGHGGMGSVYKASHTFIERKVAVKTLHEHLVSDNGILARFKTEAQASAAVVHPNLVTIYDFGLLEGKVPYIVMEFLVGCDLDDLIKRKGRLDEKTALGIFQQICDALTAAHEKGIVHRDLKPSNIMLIGEEPYTVKLVDFGIAKVLDSAHEALTQEGQSIGSPPYMSPEQCCGTSIDHRSDLYSLACVMYEAYTGRRVFESVTVLDMMMKHVNDIPNTTPLQEAGVPPRVVELIYRLLDKKPDNRPSSAKEVRRILSGE